MNDDSMIQNFRFIVLPRKKWPPNEARLKAYLSSNNWDDYGFQTTFGLVVFDGEGGKHEVGTLKIGSEGQESGVPEIPTHFEVLSEGCFSLGQDEEYYEKLKALPSALREWILVALNDMAYSEELWERHKDENVTQTSLLRSLSVRTVLDQYRRVARGGVLKTKYDFVYVFPKRSSSSGKAHLSFEVDPETNPPTNIHVLIGRNGVGKSYLLDLMIKALTAPPSVAAQSGKFINEKNDQKGIGFSKLVSVSFSAFDQFDSPPISLNDEETIDYVAIGLQRRGKDGQALQTKSSEALCKEFAESARVCIGGRRESYWLKALQTLESDPVFREADITSITEHSSSEDFKGKVIDIFKSLSSGHKIVLLALTRLVECVEEKTLVLLDEPEGHLHPPLLSAFTRALADLMSVRNGVAIVATHSPVVLQEVPKCCVWQLDRSGDILKIERPERETFGENVGVLTRDIFSYEVTESGFHQLLREAAAAESSYEGALERFSGQLGGEGRAILRAMMANKYNR